MVRLALQLALQPTKLGPTRAKATGRGHKLTGRTLTRPNPTNQSFSHYKLDGTNTYGPVPFSDVISPAIPIAQPL